VASEALPPLLAALGASSVVGPAVLCLMNTQDTRALRQVHPVLRDVVTAVPWNACKAPVVDVVRWRAALPAAVGGNVVVRRPPTADEIAALVGLAALYVDARNSAGVRDGFVAALPAATLTSLATPSAHGITPAVSYAHLTVLAVLNVGYCAVDDAVLRTLPPSLVGLNIACCRRVTRAATFSHLPALASLEASATKLGDHAIASLSPTTLHTLELSGTGATASAPFSRLGALTTLDISFTPAVVPSVLTSLPQGLVSPKLTIGADAGPTVDLRHLAALTTLMVTVPEEDPPVSGTRLHLPPSTTSLIATFDATCDDSDGLLLANATELVALREVFVSGIGVTARFLQHLPPSVVRLTVADYTTGSDVAAAVHTLLQARDERDIKLYT